jgi:PleD family two-component response regulator
VARMARDLAIRRSCKDGWATRMIQFVDPSPKKICVPKVSMISIDDDEPVSETTKGLVRSLGLNASAFASAGEFLRSDRRNDTACSITDAQMPGMSGIELQKTVIYPRLSLTYHFYDGISRRRD